MDHSLVQLIGVFPTADADLTEGFCYTVNAPTNLWMQALTDNGTRMGLHFMGYAMNELLDQDCFNEGDSAEFADQAGHLIRFIVCDLVPKDDVQAFQAIGDEVRRVRVEVVDAP